jgi:exodeoxyribonuclease VII small subunit
MKEQSKAKSGENTPEISYQDAVSELEEILSEIESGEADVDVLSEKVKRALFLINYCRARLKQTDDEVKKLIKGFEGDE